MEEEQKYYCWFITFWLCDDHGVWGLHNCVYRQTTPILNVKSVTEQIQYATNIANNTNYRFVMTNFQSITYEEFCYNGEIAFHEPSKKAKEIAQDIDNDNNQEQ